MRRWIATGLLAAVLGTMMPTMAAASSAGRMNSALGLTGGALYGWFGGGRQSSGRRALSLGLTAGSVYAWSRYAQAKRAEKRRARAAAYYRNRSYSSYQPAYSTSYRPYSRVSGYRSSYGRRSTSGQRRRSSTYLAGYRAGYRRGVRACRVAHGHA